MRPQALTRFSLFLIITTASACSHMGPMGQMASSEKPSPLRDFLVFFSAENTSLDPIGQQVIQEVAATAKEKSGRRLMIQAEASGDSAHAAFLAQERTKTVEQALVGAGIAKDRLDFGASQRQTEQVGVIARHVTIRFEP